jgi:hypothetical protein
MSCRRLKLHYNVHNETTLGETDFPSEQILMDPAKKLVATRSGANL